MQIKTITCHDVYNAGASLQAYALATYLRNQGHDVEIIDYKPDYLSKHFSFTAINNPIYDRPFIRLLYLLAKFPSRLCAFGGRRKKRFDNFTRTYLPLTSHRYHSFDDLCQHCPPADVYIAGSDQIWNPIFPNGKDPSFFLQFVHSNKTRISYAASLSVDDLSPEDSARMTPWLKGLTSISVREPGSVSLLNRLGISSISVCDPVFLLSKEEWLKLIPSENSTPPYVLVYDFDGNPMIRQAAEKLSKEHGLKIFTLQKLGYGDRYIADAGPLEFLHLIKNASVVLSNSFHATAFSIIFEREFYVFDRSDKINSRMRDLLCSLDLYHRYKNDVSFSNPPLSFSTANHLLQLQIEFSKNFLQGAV